MTPAPAQLGILCDPGQSVLRAPYYVIAALVDHVRQLFPFRHSCIVLRHPSNGKAHQPMTTAQGGGLSSLTQEVSGFLGFAAEISGLSLHGCPAVRAWSGMLLRASSAGTDSAGKDPDGRGQCDARENLVALDREAAQCPLSARETYTWLPSCR